MQLVVLNTVWPIRQIIFSPFCGSNLSDFRQQHEVPGRGHFSDGDFDQGWGIGV